MDDLYRRARKYAAGRTVLDALAGVFLGCSTAFWFVLHWTALVGPGLPSGAQLPQAVVAVAMTLIYAFALPLLLSMLVPTTPAGQLLQKTQWRTVGFPVIIVSTGVLGYYAQALIRAWFESQPSVVEGNLTAAYMVASLVGFIIIPALCWVQVTPERWIREVEQAHQVKKLELMQRGELAIVKSRLLWAEQKALVGYAKLLPAEQQEVIDTMKGLLMGVSDTQRSIARTMGVEGEIERAILGDTEIADSLDYVAKQLEKPAHTIDRALDFFDDHNREREATLDRAYGPPHVDSRSGSSESREARDTTRRHMTTGDDAYARAAADAFGRRPWTVKQLATELEIGETKAREMRDDWLNRGLIDQTNLGRWHFTESDGA